MIKELFAGEIANLLEITKRGVNKRAKKENWRFNMKKNPETGQHQPCYTFDRLPWEIQEAWAKANDKDLSVIRQELFETDCTKRKEIPFDQYPEKHRHIAIWRSRLIHLYWETAMKRELFIALYNRRELGNDIYENLKKPVGKSTLSRWISDYTHSKEDLRALCPQYSQKEGPRGAGSKSLTEQETLWIEAYWLNINKPSMKMVLTSIKELHGVEIAYHTALRYVNELPPALVTLKRGGLKKYKDKFETYVERDRTLYNSMDVVYSDHKTLDFLIIQDETGKARRAYATVMNDYRSSKILGWHISFSPNSLTVMAASQMMVEQYGAPKNAYFDNGQDYRSKNLRGTSKHYFDGINVNTIEVEGLFQEMGTTLHYCLPYNGQSKPIERWFSTLINYFDKNMNTYIGSNTVARPEEVKAYYGKFKGKKLDVTITMDALKTMFGNFVNWWNKNFTLSGKGLNGKTADQAFQENWKQKRVVPESYLRLIFSEKKPLKVGRRGLKVEGLDYYSDKIAELKGRQVIVRRPLSNIGQVYVYDEKGVFLCEATNEAISSCGITAIDLKKIQKIRKTEMEALKKRLGHVEDYQRFMPTIQDFLLKHTIKPTEMNEPEEQIAVGQNFNLPPEDQRSQLQVVKNDKPKRKIKGLF